MFLPDLGHQANRRDNKCRGRKRPNTWAEADWGAPHHQRVDLLPVIARCETCIYWMRGAGGACWLTSRIVARWAVLKAAEDRCSEWVEHPRLTEARA